MKKLLILVILVAFLNLSIKLYIGLNTQSEIQNYLSLIKKTGLDYKIDSYDYSLLNSNLKMTISSKDTEQTILQLPLSLDINIEHGPVFLDKGGFEFGISKITLNKSSQMFQSPYNEIINTIFSNQNIFENSYDIIKFNETIDSKLALPNVDFTAPSFLLKTNKALLKNSIDIKNLKDKLNVSIKELYISDKNASNTIKFDNITNTSLLKEVEDILLADIDVNIQNITIKSPTEPKTTDLSAGFKLASFLEKDFKFIFDGVIQNKNPQRSWFKSASLIINLDDFSKDAIIKLGKIEEEQSKIQYEIRQAFAKGLTQEDINTTLMPKLFDTFDQFALTLNELFIKNKTKITLKANIQTANGAFSTDTRFIYTGDGFGNSFDEIMDFIEHAKEDIWKVMIMSTDTKIDKSLVLTVPSIQPLIVHFKDNKLLKENPEEYILQGNFARNILESTTPTNQVLMP